MAPSRPSSLYGVVRLAVLIPLAHALDQHGHNRGRALWGWADSLGFSSSWLSGLFDWTGTRSMGAGSSIRMSDGGGRQRGSHLPALFSSNSPAPPPYPPPPPQPPFLFALPSGGRGHCMTAGGGEGSFDVRLDLGEDECREACARTALCATRASLFGDSVLGESILGEMILGERSSLTTFFELSRCSWAKGRRGFVRGFGGAPKAPPHAPRLLTRHGKPHRRCVAFEFEWQLTFVELRVPCLPEGHSRRPPFEPV